MTKRRDPMDREIESALQAGQFIGWSQARQAADADPGATAEILLAWMKNDDYGFCNELGSDAVKVFDSAGMAAFERAVPVRFEAACGKLEQKTGNYIRDQWDQILRSIFSLVCIELLSAFFSLVCSSLIVIEEGVNSNESKGKQH
jgi:hypothetical protein